MRSRANIQSHPIHPILVGFPIAFFSGTVITDALFLLDASGNLDFADYLHIAGLISAIAAAVPGIIDYRFTVPPESSAKKRAARHGLLNTTAFLLFVFALYLRIDGLYTWMFPIEVLALTIMAIAGWLGGTLVNRNLIGVDMRYADAGKWKEQYVENAEDLIELEGADDLKPNQMKLFHIAGKRIVLAKTEIGFTAFEDHCSHKGGSLAGGMLICGTVQCPWHGSQFDVDDGEVKAGPATEKIKIYSLVIKENKVFLDLSKTS